MAADSALEALQALNTTVDRFEQAWRSGQPPSIEDFLGDASIERGKLLVELVHTDLEYRLMAGEKVRVEDYLQRFPELEVSGAQLVELIEAEFSHCRALGRAPKVEDYLERFPRFRNDLTSRLGEIADGTLPPQEGKSRSCGNQSFGLGWDGVQPNQSDNATSSLGAGAFSGAAPANQDTHTLPPRPEHLPAGAALAQQATDTLPPRPEYLRDGATLTPRDDDAQPAEGQSKNKQATLPAVPGPAVPGYEILGVLGKGGMGVVYKARHLMLNRTVALKMVKGGAHADPAELARFRAEAEAVARLQHPNIVQIHEIGEQDRMPYLALEFCGGGSLDRKLQSTAMPPREAAKLMQALAGAVEHAHVHRVVHRDLKPGNVLLASDGTPKVTDFGLAKTLDTEGLTQSGLVIGTPSYMAPEQAAGKTRELGPAVDIYGLGAIIYELLTGRPPFKGITSLDTLQQVIRDEPVPPSRLQPKAPRDLETICLTCIQKDRRKRYASAQALADDLQRFLNNEPIHARPTSSWERLRKWARRKPAAAALVGVTALAGLALMASITLYAINESQHARILLQELKTVQDREEVRERSSQTLLRAQQHEVSEDWTAANTELEKAQEALAARPDPGADELRAEVGRRLVVVRQKLLEQRQRQQAEKRLVDFQQHYDDALFYETSFAELVAGERRIKARTAARKALATYGLDEESGPEGAIATLLERDKALHSAADHARLAGACYELLLIWSECEGAPVAGQAEAAAQSQAEKALALLARAERLGQVYGLETRTYHIRKARYLAQKKGQKLDPAETVGTVPAKSVIALDSFLEGLESYRAGQFEKASQSCGEAVRQQVNHFWARYVMALCHLHMNRWVEGKAELTVCASRRPEFVWPRLLRGYAACELGAKAQSNSQAALEFKAAEEDFDFALMQDSSLLVQYVGQVNRGVLHVRRQDWTKAIADLREAVKTYPEGLQGHINLSHALQGEGSRDAAVAALDQAIKQLPGQPLLYETRARLHLLGKHWAAARADFEEAIALEPKDSRSSSIVNNLIELGRLLNRERQYDAALASFDKALKLQPDFVLAQRFRAETLLALDRHSEAGQALDRYMAVNKSVAGEVYQVRGLIFAETGQLSAAIEMYSLALWQNDKDIQSRCHRGWTLLLTDAARLALEDFEACLREDETNLDAMIGRGNARIRLRHLDKAVQDAAAALAQAAESKVKLTDLHLYKLARIYAQAAGQLEAEARTAQPGPKRSALQRSELYQGKAVGLLRQALEEMPEDRRTAFWRNQIQSDPAFTALRAGRLYVQLAERYAGKGP